MAKKSNSPREEPTPDSHHDEAERRIRAARITRATKLDLSGLQLTALPESLGQLTQLRILDASFNRLTGVPESLGKLQSLRKLDLRRNLLTALPQSLEQLQQLQTLVVFRNGLTVLPGWLGRLARLSEIHVSHNKLTSLPESLGDLNRLEILNASDNRLTALPESLRNLTSLKELYLHGNDALGLPHERLGPTAVAVVRDGRFAASPSSILDDYFSIRGVRGRALRELKLIVVGRGGAGKTSLIKRLNGQPLDRDESETHGIVISPLVLHCPDGPVTARVWDFGGQHVLHAMHEFFLTARSLYLLVLNEREDMAERDAAYWLQLIRSYAGAAPVVVALNKSQGRPREMDHETLKQNYGPILAWIPTECDDEYPGTIAALRAALTQAVDKMPAVRARFQTKWWEIKQWLEEMPEPYLDFTTYQQLCRKLGESDTAEQDKLAEWLHDLGVALNYARDPRLHDTTVLRPDWLANGIYAILRANDPSHSRKLAPEAVLTVERLGPIYTASEQLGMLNAAEYPAEKWPFLLRLMNLFQLAYPLDEAASRLLVPTLLPVEPPPGTDEPADPDRQRLRYEFTVVPGPLIPRFLVRTFSLIEEELRWRRGAVLRYAAARARVWSTQDERWVHVTAAGSTEDRDELLTMIRGTLSDLFTEYRDLRVVEQWEYEGEWVPRKTLERMGVLLAEDQREEVEP
jgi:internalin A